jgi:uncharacterized protein (TIGR02996 family)
MSTATEYRPQYWKGAGKFKAEADRLGALVTLSGRALTIPTEMVRCVNNIAYERFNNGNRNRTSGALRAACRFIRGMREEVVDWVEDIYTVGLFDFNWDALRAAMAPFCAMRGDATEFWRENDIVCDTVYKYAAVLSGEPVKADSEEQGFLDAITKDPTDSTSRLVYADWLDDKGLEERGRAVRMHAFLLKFDGTMAARRTAAKNAEELVIPYEAHDQLRELRAETEAGLQVVLAKQPINRCLLVVASDPEETLFTCLRYLAFGEHDNLQWQVSVDHRDCELADAMNWLYGKRQYVGM